MYISPLKLMTCHVKVYFLCINIWIVLQHLCRGERPNWVCAALRYFVSCPLNLWSSSPSWSVKQPLDSNFFESVLPSSGVTGKLLDQGTKSKGKYYSQLFFFTYYALHCFNKTSQAWSTFQLWTVECLVALYYLKQLVYRQGQDQKKLLLLGFEIMRSHCHVTSLVLEQH